MLGSVKERERERLQCSRQPTSHIKQGTFIRFMGWTTSVKLLYGDDYMLYPPNNYSVLYLARYSLLQELQLLKTGQTQPFKVNPTQAVSSSG